MKYALHLLPSGILTPTCVPVIANGVVIDPSVLQREMQGLQARGIDTDRLVISSNAHIIAPYHVGSTRSQNVSPVRRRSGRPAGASAHLHGQGLADRHPGAGSVRP